ncbi:MAG: hypothetical protein AB7C95_04695 [Synergistaceae bacterium]
MNAVYVSREDQMEELKRSYKYKTMLSVRDLQNIFGWSKSDAYRKIKEGVFIPFGDIPEGSKKIHKKIVFKYFDSLF